MNLPDFFFLFTRSDNGDTRWRQLRFSMKQKCERCYGVWTTAIDQSESSIPSGFITRPVFTLIWYTIETANVIKWTYTIDWKTMFIQSEDWVKSIFCCNTNEPGTIIKIKITFWQLSKIIPHLLNIYLCNRDSWDDEWIQGS